MPTERLKKTNSPGRLDRLLRSREYDPQRPGLAILTMFLAPALLIYGAFTAWPVFRTFYNSFNTVLPRGKVDFVGFDNYRALLFEDATFWKAISNTMTWATVAPVLDVGLGLGLALILYAKIPFARFFRVAWFTPVLISYVVVGILWMWIYNYDWGVANELLRLVGLENLVQPWLGNPDTALWSLILAQLWQWAGFNMVVCLAALHALPSEVLEASELDNCGWFEKTIYVIIPMIRPTLVNLLIISFIGKMKVFDLVWIMTQGGPLWSTETVSTYVFKRAFDWDTFDLGYPSTIATVWFLVVVAFVLTFNQLFRSKTKLEY